MITTLRIKNLVIVDELCIDFSPGLNVLTGETGAGKSILLKALALLLGVRASSEVVRLGQKRAEIEAIFTIEASLRQQLFASLAVEEGMKEILTDLLPEGTEELLIRRTIEVKGENKGDLRGNETKGTSRVFVNGAFVPLHVLQKIVSWLVEVTGQHEQHKLTRSDYHGLYLDRYGDLLPLVEKVGLAFERYVQAKKALDSFVEQRERQEEYLRRLRFELEELEALRPVKGEIEDLEQQEKAQAHHERLLQLAEQGLSLLEADEQGIMRKLRQVEQCIVEAERYEPRFGDLAQSLAEAKIQLEEVSFGLEKIGGELEANPEQLELLRERISRLKAAQRKYRKTVDELALYWQQIKNEIGESADLEQTEAQLQKTLSTEQGALRQIEAELSALRKKAGERLSRAVESALGPLEMKQAKFQVAVSPGISTPRGADKVEFLIATNPGAGFSPLARTASGGELSRVLLVLKTIIGEEQESSLQVFDEVDAGISGAVAQVVGEKLALVSRRSQILCVTHSPQVAAMASRHLHIAKHVQGNETRVEVKVLEEEDRVKELARMLAGRKVTANFEDSARELLAHRTHFASVSEVAAAS